MQISRLAQSSIGQRHFEQISYWRAKQRAFAERSIASNQATTDSFAGISAGLAQGMADIATRRATARVEAHYQKRIAELQKLT